MVSHANTGAVLLAGLVLATTAPAAAQDPSPESPPTVLELPVTVETPGDTRDFEGETNTGALVSFLVAGTALVNAAVFGTMALTENARLDDACPCDDSEVDDLRAYAIVTDVSLIVAGVGIAVGTVFALTWDDDDGDSVALTPTGLRARF